MDILRFAITSFVVGTLIIGCDDQSTPQGVQKNQLVVQAKEGTNKKYWIQGYSMITQNNHVDWSTKDTVGISLLANYQVQSYHDKEIKLNVLADYTELQVRGLAAYPSTSIQTILNKGMLYQFNLGSNQPQAISIQDTALQQGIEATAAIKQEYQYLQFIIAPPFIPAAIPLAKQQQIVLDHFMGLNKVTVQVDEITDNKLFITLLSTEQANKLYGKAIINKMTGWIEKMALVKDTQIAGSANQSMRTLLLMGPARWSNNSQHQLIKEINNNDSRYLQSFPIKGFDKVVWEQQQQQESALKPSKGELFVLNMPNAPKQLMLLITNSVGATNNLGQYKVENAKVEQQTELKLLPAPNLDLNTAADNKTINVATYKPILNPATANERVATVKAISADVSFTPYQLEILTLPINNKKEQTISSVKNDFSISITPINKSKTFLISWQNKENVYFDINLINGAKNATVQMIQPTTSAWLTPSESNIINGLSNNQVKAQINFDGEIPNSLEINLLKQGNKAIYTYPVLFK